VYSPTSASTVPLTDTSKAPSTESVAVAPRSEYTVPCSIVMLASPFKVITGEPELYELLKKNYPLGQTLSR
jgi:hypothetical protein